jgi:hypothetical protein
MAGRHNAGYRTGVGLLVAANIGRPVRASGGVGGGLSPIPTDQRQLGLILCASRVVRATALRSECGCWALSATSVKIVDSGYRLAPTGTIMVDY